MSHILSMQLPPCLPLSVDEQRNLAIAAKGGDIEARNALVMSNQKLLMKNVVSFAHHYSIERELDMSDLFQVGILAMMTAAIDKYNPDRYPDIPWSIYAMLHCKNAFRRHRAGANVVTISCGAMHRASNQSDDIAKHGSLLAGYRACCNIKSLEPGDLPESPHDDLESKHQLEKNKRKLRNGLNTLSDRDRLFIALRYGLDEGKPYKLRQIGAVFGHTHQWASKVDRQITKKLRKHMRTTTQN